MDKIENMTAIKQQHQDEYMLLQTFQVTPFGHPALIMSFLAIILFDDIKIFVEHAV